MQNARLRWIKHKGKEILYIDFKNCIEEEALLVLEEGRKQVENKGIKVLLTLFDLTTAYYTDRIINKSKKLLARGKKLGVKNINAFIGLTGIKKTIVNSLMKHNYAVQSFDEGLDILAQKADELS